MVDVEIKLVVTKLYYPFVLDSVINFKFQSHD